MGSQLPGGPDARSAGVEGRQHVTPRGSANDSSSARSAQQLQALGRFAGGMAHEVNNMMTAIMGFGRLAASSLTDDHPSRGDLDEIVKAAERAATVTRQLLMFNRQQGLPASVVDLGALVSQSVPMLTRTVGPDLRLQVNAPVPGPRANIHASQLEQVLVNLVANARDASPPGAVVEVTVREETIASDGASVGSPEAVARIDVRDAGSGMSAEVLSRAFDPFFTTKDMVRGTGLGLSVVQEIVRQWDGTIVISSAPGSGTTVTIRLPKVDRELSSAPTDQGVVLRGRGERILVVEDEALVGTVVRRLLTSMGYSVAVAPHAAGALEYLQQHARDVDLVLADVIMPGLTGVELAMRIREGYPGVGVLLMSGYTGEEIVRRGGAYEGLRIIQKPFAPEALGRVVRTALDTASSPEGSGNLPRN